MRKTPHQRNRILPGIDELLIALRLSSSSHESSPAKIVALAIAFHPGFLILDAIHFQYNGFLFGLMIWSLVGAKEASPESGGSPVVASTPRCFIHEANTGCTTEPTAYVRGVLRGSAQLQVSEPHHHAICTPFRKSSYAMTDAPDISTSTSRPRGSSTSSAPTASRQRPVRRVASPRWLPPNAWGLADAIVPQA